MKSVSAVVVAGGLRFLEIPPVPIREGEVLVKVLSAALTPLDIAAARGYTPYVYGKIAGSAGLVRVIELGYGVENVAVGENAILSPRCSTELALFKNGVMAEQSSVHFKCLEPVPQSVDSLVGLHTSLLAHVPSVISSLSGSSILIAGCSYEAYTLTKLVKDEVRTEVLCVSEAGLRKIAKLGVKAYLWEKAGGYYDSVYIASLDSYVNSIAVKRCRDTLYISPTVPEYFVPIGVNLKSIVTLSQAKIEIVKALNLSHNLSREIETVYKIVDNFKAVAESADYTKYLAYIRPSGAENVSDSQE
ncbi:MAG: hypothetical protein RMI56_04720 [Sulfolobales archaeon]|nr:hypothetical protein [Sulfolobales archaeon]MDW8083087.1 hypothetical protein [Sulfolobales archaeon]